MSSRREVSSLAAMAKKRDTDDFQRIRQSDPVRGWDDDEPDPEASTYAFAEHGPDPVPAWVITSDAARQYELGELKSGKEATVHLIERRLGDATNVLAAKRYLKFEDRMFRNDARYRAGRRTGESRLDRAIARGNRAGMAFRAQQWLDTEFDALCRLWVAGAPVPYPVQKLGNELLLELIGSPEQAAPRLVHAKPSAELSEHLWHQLLDALRVMIGIGLVHGDLSPYNTLVDGDRLVIIDFPQAVDPIANPEGLELLQRDVTTMGRWFEKRGVACDPSEVMADLVGLLF